MSGSRSHLSKLVPELAGLACILVLASCASPSGNHPAQMQGDSSWHPIWPGFADTDTWNDIHVFQTFDYHITDPAAVASRYDFIWGASLQNVAAYRAGNPQVFLSYYIPFHRDVGTFANATQLHDLTYWQAVHPDWVLYKCDRTTPAYEFDEPRVPLDFANPDLVSWQIETYAIPASEHGYDGLAADNVDLDNQFGACGVYVNGTWVQRYTGARSDSQWRRDVLAWLARMRDALHRLPHPMALIPNLALGSLSATDPIVQKAVTSVDGVVDEGGFTEYGEGYLTGAQWVQRVRFMEDVQQSGEPYYVINRLSAADEPQIAWALASYLMGKEHAASLFISGVDGYGIANWYDDYRIPIGSPRGPMYSEQSVYVRQYTHGLSIVNPSPIESHVVSLGTSKRYVDVQSHRVGDTVTLGPHAGLVLLAQS